MRTHTIHTQATVKTVKASHTPGPWLQWGPENQAIVFSDTKGPVVVAVTDTDKAIGYLARQSNAKLIAAAPEMLEALQGALRNLIMFHGSDCKCKECHNVKSAISKATA